MKYKKLLAVVSIICFTLVPATVAFAKTSDTLIDNKGVTVTGDLTYTNNSSNSGTVSVGQALTSMTPTVSGGVTVYGGMASLKVMAIGSMMMDADWTIESTTGPITYINASVLFDNGIRIPFKYSSFGSVQRNSAQTTFSTIGYHQASFSATGTIGLMFDFTCTPLSAKDYVYPGDFQL